MTPAAQPCGAPRRPLDPGAAAPEGRNRELVRLAVMAANSHNTQPWLFDARAGRITLRADWSRRLPVVDPDDHHLHVSLGCAAENLVIAATGFGIAAIPRVAEGGAAIDIDLDDQGGAPSALIAAIPQRQSTRGTFDATPLSASERRALQEAATGPGVTFHLIEAPGQMAKLGEMAVAGNAAQMANPAFTAELLHWIRFGARKAAARRDGLFARCMGNPALPDWTGRIVFPLVFRTKPETVKLRRQIASASALAVFVSDRDTPENWIETGRAFQRFALTATSMGLLHAHVNQAVEVPEQRALVARLLGAGQGRPSLMVRLGRGETMPYSYRRDVDAVLQPTTKGC